MARPLNPAAGRYDLKARPEDIRLWAQAADAMGVELASWIRMTLNRAAASPRKRRQKGKEPWLIRSHPR